MSEDIINSVVNIKIRGTVKMPAQLSASRGPILNCTSNSRTISGSPLTYIKDALVILDGEKIINFGPTDKLKSLLPEEIFIEHHRACRIIKSVANS